MAISTMVQGLSLHFHYHLSSQLLLNVHSRHVVSKHDLRGRLLCDSTSEWQRRDGAGKNGKIEKVKNNC